MQELSQRDKREKSNINIGGLGGGGGGWVVAEGACPLMAKP